MTLVLSLAQLSQVNKQVNEAFIDDLVLFLNQQCGPQVRSLGAHQFRADCAEFVLACTNLTAQSRLDVFTLAEMVLSFQSKLSLDALPAVWLDCLHDERFTFSERVDVLTLRLAFPAVKPTKGEG
jgi:hypothetical protein